MSTIELKCTHCNKSFVQLTRYYNYHSKKKPGYKFFCSSSCQREFNGGTTVVACQECGKNFKKNNSAIKTGKGNFCTRNCAGKYNNRKRYENGQASPLKLPRPKCISNSCVNEAFRTRGGYCAECIKEKKHYQGSGSIILQTIEFASRRGGANRYDSIRANARHQYRDELNNPCCEKCGYNKHVELCHIIPISAFPKDTIVEIVNRRDNIVFLCPIS